MVCPLCDLRKPKRLCPALGRQICTVCCGTKRQVEINCPSDCPYLTSAREHPPAVVQRQLEQDRARLWPVVAGLTDRQARLLLMFAGIISRHRADAFQRLVDGDIAQAAEAHAATLETSLRGIVYEHRPATLPAERLLGELRTLTAQVARDVGSSVERDASIALRRIEAAARESSNAEIGSTAFQQMLIRMLARGEDPGQEPKPAPEAATARPEAKLIIP